MGLLTKASSWVARNLGLADPRLYAHFGSEPTDAGEAVSIEGSLQIDTVWACVRLIAQTIATLPLELYRVETGGQRRLADDETLYRVLHDRPNADMTAVEFWECMVGCLLLWGNAYAEKAYGVRGEVIALNPLRPDRLTPRPAGDGSVEYVYSYNGQTRPIAEGDMLHVKGFSLDGMVGLSPIAQARNNLASARAAERAAGAIFRNGMRPSGFLKAPTYLTPAQRSDAKKLLETFKGATNTGAVPLLEGGWEFESLSIPPEDAQLLQSRAWHVEQICRWFDTPPVLIGHMEKATSWGSGLEQVMLWFLMVCLRSHLKRIEQAITKGVLTPAQQTVLYPKFNIEGLLRADSAARSTLYSTFVQNGIATRNEVRAKENLPAMPGGDELTVQTNLIPIGMLGQAVGSQPVGPERSAEPPVKQ